MSDKPQSTQLMEQTIVNIIRSVYPKSNDCMAGHIGAVESSIERVEYEPGEKCIDMRVSRCGWCGMILDEQPCFDDDNWTSSDDYPEVKSYRVERNGKMVRKIVVNQPLDTDLEFKLQDGHLVATRDYLERPF